jgi:hypothetical protein
VSSPQAASYSDDIWLLFEYAKKIVKRLPILMVTEA